MSGDRAASMAFMLLALMLPMLPLSALISRRMSMTRTVRLILIWAVIIGGLAIVLGALRSTSTLAHFT